MHVHLSLLQNMIKQGLVFYFCIIRERW